MIIIKIKSVEDIYPSVEDLSKVGIAYKVNDDGSVEIKLNAQNFKVAHNKDIPPLMKGNWPNADISLSYFVITNHLIVASGDLQSSDDKTFVCNGPLRVFSKDPILTYEYIACGQEETAQKDALNGYMLDISSKGANTK